MLHDDTVPTFLSVTSMMLMLLNLVEQCYGTYIVQVRPSYCRCMYCCCMQVDIFHVDNNQRFVGAKVKWGVWEFTVRRVKKFENFGFVKKVIILPRIQVL